MIEKGYIVINLRPYREKLKKQKIQQFAALVALFAIAALGVVVAGSTYFSVQQSEQESRNKFIEKANSELDGQIAEIGTLKETIAETLSKRRVVESLQVNRSDGVSILNEISLQLPEGVRLESITQRGNRLTIVGFTTSNSKISTYMSSLEDTPVFKDAQILEVKLAPQKTNSTEKTKSNNAPLFKESQFTLVVDMEKEIIVEEETKHNSKKK